MGELLNKRYCWELELELDGGGLVHVVCYYIIKGKEWGACNEYFNACGNCGGGLGISAHCICLTKENAYAMKWGTRFCPRAPADPFSNNHS